MEKKVRGVVFASIKEVLIEKYGLSKFSEFLKSLPYDIKAFFEKSIDLGEFYPYEKYKELYDRIVDFFKNDIEKLMIDIGRTSIKISIETSFNSLIKKTEIFEFIKKLGEFIFSYYFNFGKLEVKYQDLNNRKMSIHLTNLPFKDKHFENRIKGAILGIFEIYQMKDIKIETTKSIASGDPYVEFLVKW